MRIRLDGGLLLVTATLTLGGRTRELQNVLLDTGSSGSLFAADPLLEMGVVAEPDDRLRRIRGVGGSEFVFTRRADRVAAGELEAFDFEIEIGAMDYGFPIDGLLGVDFFRATSALIDLAVLEIRRTSPSGV